MGKRLSKKSEKVIRKVMEERLFEHPLVLIAKIGGRVCPELDSGMMLQVAMQEEITDFLKRNYYERPAQAKGRRNGSKKRTVKLSCGDVVLDITE